MDPEQPLIPRTTTVHAAVDFRGLPASRPNTGGWNSALFIIGVEIAERIAYFGVSTNLITYLTGTLGESTAVAAASVNAWAGASSMLPLLGGLLADSWLGRYRTITAASLLYILGLVLLTLSAITPWLQPKCNDDGTCSSSNFQVGFFFCSIYMVSFAQGGHKPCVQAFGADQFDNNDPVECKSRSSFFNWWYFSMFAGTTVITTSLSYIQDNISWGLGFGIPCLSMVLALLVFLLGRKTYRYHVHPQTDLFNKSSSLLKQHDGLCPHENISNLEHPRTESKLCCSGITSAMKKFWKVDNAAAVFKLFPIWATCLVYAVVFAQSSTFFTKQGSTMDRRIGPTFQVPPAALQSFISITIVAFIPIYDRILIPIARKFTGLPSGITMLQRIGTGMLLSMISMLIAALVEMRRLKLAEDSGVIDRPGMAVPMSICWLVPQYILFGVADVFTMVGLQEFFYGQVPTRLRSLGLALYLSIFGIGSFISGFIVCTIDKVTKENGQSWFADNLNHGHLDYFYFLLAVSSSIELIVYLYFSVVYVQMDEDAI